jgi:hypothetical protein
MRVRNTPWPEVRIGQVLAYAEELIKLDDLREYITITVKRRHGGLEPREKLFGHQVKTKKQYRLIPGAFLISRIQCWHQAYSIVPETIPGNMIASQNYDQFIISPDVDHRFFWWFSHSPLFTETVRSSAFGVVIEKMVFNRDAWLEKTIPLPPLDEQRRIVSRIEELAAKAEVASGLRKQAGMELEAMLLTCANRMFPCEGTTLVGDFARIQSGYAFKSDWFTESGIRLVRNVNIGHGHIMWHETARIPENRCGEFVRFQLSRGDILVSLDRPIISTGVKVARVTDNDLPSLLLQRVGRVCFVGEGVLPEYFFLWLRSPRFTLAIDPGRSNGIPHISPKDIERIPFAPPPIEEQRKIVAYLNDLNSEFDALRKLQSETTTELDALMPSILSRAFRGEL